MHQHQTRRSYAHAIVPSPARKSQQQHTRRSDYSSMHGPDRINALWHPRLRQLRGTGTSNQTGYHRYYKGQQGYYTGYQVYYPGY
mmetsp:Transcript_34818/g.62235  ORF Transcript_34818/g.62235 Transcript_34818/m.62235 type:complete len:85 (+) Transcript_34818:320-574(+)